MVSAICPYCNRLLEMEQKSLEQMVLSVASGKNKKSDIAAFFRNQPECQKPENNNDSIISPQFLEQLKKWDGK